MKIPERRERKAVAGILAGVILFAMLFTAGVSLFLYEFTLNHQYDLASQYNTGVASSQTHQGLSIVSAPAQGNSKSTRDVSATVANAGGNSSKIVQFFIRNQTSQVVCVSPAIGKIPTCSTQAVGSVSISILPSTFTMGAGSSVNVTTGISSTNTQLLGCNVATACSVNVVTSLGNVFTGAYPLPNPLGIIITTTLNGTQIGPGNHIFDTAILTGASNNAGGQVIYSWWTDGDCGISGGVKTSLPAVTVTNGVVPNSQIVQFNVDGQFSFRAQYTGDAAHGDPAATSACEPFNVAQPGQCVPTASNFCFATVAQGLGSLAFDFDSFKWYSTGACAVKGNIGVAPPGPCTLHDGLAGAFSVGGASPAPRAYTISQAGMTNAGTNLFFSINVTNADPQGRSITLDAFTQVWFSWFCPEVIGSNGPCSPGPHGQSASTYIGMVIVSNTGVTSTSVPSLVLPYKSTATIYFGLQEGDAGTFPGIPLCGFSGSLPSTSDVTPVFMFFHGTIGSNNLAFGQNFPLASVLWTNIGGSC